MGANVDFLSIAVDETAQDGYISTELPDNNFNPFN